MLVLQLAQMMTTPSQDACREGQYKYADSHLESLKCCGMRGEEGRGVNPAVASLHFHLIIFLP